MASLQVGRAAARALRATPRLACHARLSTLVTIPEHGGPPHWSRSQLCRRSFSTPAPRSVDVSDLSEERYHKFSDATMDLLLESLEELLDEQSDPEYEVDYTSGVLTLNLGTAGTYVINKQPPNKQIWLSSPISGPKRYDYSLETNDWIYLRDGTSLRELLDRELSQTLNVDIKLPLKVDLP